MKIAIGQMNSTVGALKPNAQKMRSYAEQAKAQNADLIVFPEMALTGYPPKDLLETAGFVENNVKVLNQLASEIRGISVIAGFVEPNPVPAGKPFYNAAAVLRDGRVVSVYRKSLLPTYDVFDEGRYFEPATNQE